jgi:hypothetical protein
MPTLPAWEPKPNRIDVSNTWSLQVNTPHGAMTLYGALTEQMTSAYPLAAWQSEKHCDPTDTMTVAHVLLSFIAFAGRVSPGSTQPRMRTV